MRHSSTKLSTASVGKTSLAVHWAYQVRRSFPDGQLYADLRGFGSGAMLDPAAVLRRFLDAYGVPVHRIPAGLDELAALYRSVLADRRVLVVLDNARDDEQVRPLLPGSPGCAVVVTSRNQLTGLVAFEGARSITLGLLTDEEACDLLTRRIGADRVAAETAAAQRDDHFVCPVAAGYAVPTTTNVVPAAKARSISLLMVLPPVFCRSWTEPWQRGLMRA